MELKQVWIEPGCITCSSCEIICPDVFEVQQTSSTVVSGCDLEGYREFVIEAAEACPVEVIKYRVE